MTDISDIQERMRTRLAQVGIARAQDIPRVADRGVGPLSSAQRRMLLHQLRNPGSTAYNLCIALTFEGTLNAVFLAEAFSRVVRRHEILRTTYHVDDDGAFFQRIHESLSFAPDIVEAGPVEERVFSEDVEARARAAAPLVYDLSAESPIRVQIIWSKDRTAAILSMHHIAWDGMTFAALSRDLETAYSDVASGSDTIRPLRVQNMDHATWEQTWLETADHTAVRQHWRSMLLPVPEPLQLQAKSSQADGLHADRRDRTLTHTAHTRLRELAAEAHVTPFAVMLASYYLALQRLSAQDDIVIGTAVASRNHADLDVLVGNFGNTLPLRLRAMPGETFGALIKTASRVISGALSHQEYPFDLVVNDLAPDNDRDDRGLVSRVVSS